MPEHTDEAQPESPEESQAEITPIPDDEKANISDQDLAKRSTAKLEQASEQLKELKTALDETHRAGERK